MLDTISGYDPPEQQWHTLYDPDPVTTMINRDKASWEQRLREEAAARGLAYDPSDLEDVVRNVSYHGNQGRNPSEFLDAAIKKYGERARPSTPAGAGAGGGNNGFPTPQLNTAPQPQQWSAYSSGFRAQAFQRPPAVGVSQRNRIAESILDNPRTMGEPQKSALFESQKEIANAARAANRAVLNQSIASRGLSSVGGTAINGQNQLDADLTTALLKSSRDVETYANERNRADELAAITMQQAIANGDFGMALDAFNADAGQQAQQEQFLQSAAGLNQSGIGLNNSSNLNTFIANQNAMMDFYKFLEAQRQYENDLRYRYAAMTAPR